MKSRRSQDALAALVPKEHHSYLLPKLRDAIASLKRGDYRHDRDAGRRFRARLAAMSEAVDGLEKLVEDPDYARDWAAALHYESLRIELFRLLHRARTGLIELTETSQVRKGRPPNYEPIVFAYEMRSLFRDTGLKPSVTSGGVFERVLKLCLQEAGYNYSDEYVHHIAVQGKNAGSGI